MDIIFNRFSGSITKEIVLRMVENLGVKQVYSICAKIGEIRDEDVAPFGCKVRQFNAYDTYNGIYADTDWNKLEPLDEKTLLKFAPLEAELMRMMEKEQHLYTPFNYNILSEEEKSVAESVMSLRPQKYLTTVTGLSVDERKRIYFRHLRFWLDFFKHNKVDLLVFANSIHFIYEYVMFRVAESMGIPSVTGYLTPIPGRWMINFGISEFGNGLEEIYLDLKSKHKPEEITFKPYYQSEWERLTAPFDRQRKTYYGDIEQWENMANNNRFAAERLENNKARKVNVRPSFAKKIIPFLQRRLDIDFIHYKRKYKNKQHIQKKFSDFYEALCVEPNFDEKYIYFPMHMQPEETTAPKGGVFADQSLIVQMLSYYLPEGWFIYIKEHHAQVFKHRFGEFYLDLYNNPKVKLISKEVSTFKLSQYCQAVATIVGTAGWEALFKGKPVLMYGYYLYQYAPGVFRIKNNQDCENAINKIVNNEVKLDINNMKYYLKAVEISSVEAAINPEDIEYLKISNEDNIELMTNAFINFIRTYPKTKHLLAQMGTGV